LFVYKCLRSIQSPCFGLAVDPAASLLSQVREHELGHDQQQQQQQEMRPSAREATFGRSTVKMLGQNELRALHATESSKIM